MSVSHRRTLPSPLYIIIAALFALCFVPASSAMADDDHACEVTQSSAGGYSTRTYYAPPAQSGDHEDDDGDDDDRECATPITAPVKTPAALGTTSSTHIDNSTTNIDNSMHQTTINPPATSAPNTGSTAPPKKAKKCAWTRYHLMLMEVYSKSERRWVVIAVPMRTKPPFSCVTKSMTSMLERYKARQRKIKAKGGKSTPARSAKGLSLAG
ncbi:MAG TPA: hypothetical protein VF272_00275 [Candidatus Saccharimonadia bacterium]